MKIRLSAFGEKLVGYMEVPENTTPRFDLMLMQPIQAFNDGFTGGKDIPLMSGPLHTRCTFEWTGKVEMFGEGARIYVLTKIDPMGETQYRRNS